MTRDTCSHGSCCRLPLSGGDGLHISIIPTRIPTLTDRHSAADKSHIQTIQHGLFVWLRGDVRVAAASTSTSGSHFGATRVTTLITGGTFPSLLRETVELQNMEILYPLVALRDD